MNGDIILSEFLPNPRERYKQEWVELFNRGAEAIDLVGWRIDDDEGGGAPVTLGSDTWIGAQEYLVIELPKAILNNGGDTLRLLRPDGSVADEVSFSQTKPDHSWGRNGDTWLQYSEPSPGFANAPIERATTPTAPAVANPAQPAPQQASGEPTRVSAGAPAHAPAAMSELPASPVSMSSIHNANPLAYAYSVHGTRYNGLLQATNTVLPQESPEESLSSLDEMHSFSTLAIREQSSLDEQNTSPSLSSTFVRLFLFVGIILALFYCIKSLMRLSSAPESP